MYPEKEKIMRSKKPVVTPTEQHQGREILKISFSLLREGTNK
jgi:hypothetical protein